MLGLVRRSLEQFCLCFFVLCATFLLELYYWFLQKKKIEILPLSKD